MNDKKSKITTSTQTDFNDGPSTSEEVAEETTVVIKEYYEECGFGNIKTNEEKGKENET